MSAGLRDFLEIPYDELEEMNLEAKAGAPGAHPADKMQRGADEYLTDEKRIKAVTVCFTDLEGRLHMLDYDKKFLLKSADNLTFDGSSIRGFSRAAGVRPAPRRSTGRPSTGCRPTSSAPARCWSSARCSSATARPTVADMRARLKALHRRSCSRRTARVCNVANEIEGFLFKGRDAERHYARDRASSTSSPPAATTTRCRATRCGTFIDTAAEVQRAMGFANEKDHPEVAPVAVRDELHLRRGARSAPTRCSSTSCSAARSPTQLGHDRLLPAQAGHRRQRQRHAHQHVGRPKGDTNLFYDEDGKDGLSDVGLGVHRPHPHQRARHLPGAQPERQRLPPPRPALRGAEPDQGLGRSTAARWCASRSATSARRASRCARSRPTRTRTWRSTRMLRTGLEGPHRRGRRASAAHQFLPDNIYDAIDSSTAAS